MKKLFTLATALLALALTTNAAEVEWQTDFEKAKAQAAEQNKYMLLDFTGSDWCGWCIRLKKEVFSQTAFKEYANQNLITVELDFPNKKVLPDETKAQNEKLAKKYGIRGYPTILILSPSGDLVGTTGYRRGGAEPYVEHLQEIIKKADKSPAAK